MKSSHQESGFTLLLSLLVISVILSVSFGVFDVMTKELKLSGLGRESQIAFYAADAGIECAYFWDIKQKEFENEDGWPKTDANYSIECANKVIGKNFSFDGGKYTTDFQFDMGIATTQKCAMVTVTKSIENKKVENIDYKITTTTIESKGYNYWCTSTSPHKVERAIRVISTKTEEVE